jgi:hypothetical protein
MITWNKVAHFLKVGNRAEVRINLFSFLNGFKVIRCEIIDDTLIISLKNTKPDPN